MARSRPGGGLARLLSSLACSALKRESSVGRGSSSSAPSSHSRAGSPDARRPARPHDPGTDLVRGGWFTHGRPGVRGPGARTRWTRMLILNESEIRALVDAEMARTAIEGAFRALHRGEATLANVI